MVVIAYAIVNAGTMKESCKCPLLLGLNEGKIPKVLTRSINLDTSRKSFDHGMAKDVGTKFLHLLHKFTFQLIIMQYLKLGKFLLIGGKVKNKAFPCWEELLYTLTRKIVSLSSLISSWGRKNRICLVQNLLSF